MLEKISSQVREEVLREIEYCVPIFSQKVYQVSARYPALTRFFANVLTNKRIIPQRLMNLAPYIFPSVVKAVGILLGREKMRDYETEARIYQKVLVNYLEQDMKLMELTSKW